ncbi:MAG: BMP family ABC transporter substrate-binding protein [Clostridia bacterium]|jgi:basic membrane protein A|nr:BMP family ABC transporter substrate-binding protein [Clostridia bacterium]
MKKILAILLAAMLCLGCVAFAEKIVLVTDVGTIDDESFNQACWQGVEAYAKANGVEYDYYQPQADSTDARLDAIDQAVSEGATVIVMPGYLFGEALITAQDNYSDVKFIAVDVGSGDLTYDYVTYYDAAPNAVCVTFAEEQAGWLAGYAAVKAGYTKLGYLGGMAVPAVIRYGYGYVQGANYAANEMGVEIEIKYTYGGQFFGDASITAKMEGWYQTGTEVVFSCGGGIYTSAVEAAMNNNGKVIGVDVDQSYISECIITSAMKGLQNVTESILADLFEGNWDNYGGKFLTYSLNEGDYVGIPTAEGSWKLNGFTVEEYNAVVDQIKNGTIVIDNSIDVDMSTVANVDYIA